MIILIGNYGTVIFVHILGRFLIIGHLLRLDIMQIEFDTTPAHPFIIESDEML